MKSRFRMLVFGAVGAVIAFGGPASLSTAAVAEDAQPSLVETFDYPNAAAIEAARGIKLKKGDGHILFVDCADGQNQLKVESTAFPAPRNLFCFKITGAKGDITMELPEAYLVHGNNDNVVATWTDENGKVHSTPIRKNAPTGIGEGVTGQPGVLIEFNSTR